MKSRSDESFIAVYKKMYDKLEEKGFKPALNVTDKKYSKAVQNYIKSQSVGYFVS